MTFWVPGMPEPKRRHRSGLRGGRIVTYTDQRTKLAQEHVRLATLPYRPPCPWTGALRVEMVAVRLPPASWPKARRESAANGDAEFPTARPDADNVAKLLLDSLNGFFWRDDAQVVQLLVSKRYGRRPGIAVTVEAARAKRAY
jgi:Holliday junction resolvase RusA-like endonuclease